jgi:cysteinyl-tRNA synthetase
MEDMAVLGVRQPDVLTRVTEYVPRIVDYISQIVSKGLAYESNGSVYMDIDAFRQGGHDYGKLKPFKGETSAVDMVRYEQQQHKRTQTHSVNTQHNAHIF